MFKVNKINYILSLKDCEEDVDKDFYTDNYALIDYNPKKIKYPSDLFLKDIK